MQSNHSNKTSNPRSIRSYTCREGRLTPMQEKCWETLWPQFGITLPTSLSGSKTINSEELNFDELFKRGTSDTVVDKGNHGHRYRILEIGFGDGASLAEMAKNFPEHDFLGIEVYRRGVAKLLERIEKLQLANIRIICGDAVEILKHIPDQSLNTIQLFFSDPWPKTRHHKRRLIQAEFIDRVARKLCLGGKLHLATDWEDYAKQMMKILSEINSL